MTEEVFSFFFASLIPSKSDSTFKLSSVLNFCTRVSTFNGSFLHRPCSLAFTKEVRVD